MNEGPIERRKALRLMAAAGATALAACAGGKKAVEAASSASTQSSTSTSSSASTNASSKSTRATDPIPEETAGPFPGDGTNGPNALTQDGVVRRDIRSSFAGASGTATGVPLTIKFAMRDAATGLAMPGAAVYVWHCDKDGQYSMYSGAADANYLRGVQEAGSDGVVAFDSIFPGAYSGRWPHIHFEVYPSAAKATSGNSAMATSQIALPEDACNAAYAASGYERSASQMTRASLSSDMVFRDGWDDELGTVTGSVDSGFTVELDVPV